MLPVKPMAVAILRNEPNFWSESLGSIRVWPQKTIIAFGDVCRFGPKIKGFQTLFLYLWWYVRLGLVGLTKGMMPP